MHELRMPIAVTERRIVDIYGGERRREPAGVISEWLERQVPACRRQPHHVLQHRSIVGADIDAVRTWPQDGSHDSQEGRIVALVAPGAVGTGGGL